MNTEKPKNGNWLKSAGIIALAGILVVSLVANAFQITASTNRDFPIFKAATEVRICALEENLREIKTDIKEIRRLLEERDKPN